MTLIRRLAASLRFAAAPLAVLTVTVFAIAAPDPAAALTGIICKDPLSSVIRLNNGATTTSSIAFVELTGFNITVPGSGGLG